MVMVLGTSRLFLQTVFSFPFAPWFTVWHDSMAMNLGELQEIVRTEEPGVLQSTGSQQARHDLGTEQLQQSLSSGGDRYTKCTDAHAHEHTM